MGWASTPRADGWRRPKPPASSSAISARCATMRPTFSMRTGSRRDRIATPPSCSASRTRSWSRTARRGLSGALLRGLRLLSRLSAWTRGRSCQSADWAANLARFGPRSGRSRAANGGNAHVHQRQLVAATRRPWRAADLGRDRAGRAARANWAAGRRLRFRLRQYGGPRGITPRGPAADSAGGTQSGPQLHPGLADSPISCSIRDSPSSTMAMTSFILIFGSCTGAAEIRSTITRISIA